MYANSINLVGEMRTIKTGTLGTIYNMSDRVVSADMA